MTEQDWWALLDADPDSFPWSVLADWLEDRGDPRADVARAVGRAGWRPRYQPSFGTWDWWRAGAASPPGPEDLPPGVFDRLPEARPGVPDGWAEYPSPAAACRALLDALVLDSAPRPPS
jgi:hypothetical protein